ncbi:MAG: hypothetical protein HYY13_02755 [Nitrospirae bacterium]|nr:hypothetical protein [Nitrospirota bacterium]
MPLATQERIQTRIGLFKERIKKAGSGEAARAARKKLKRAQRKLRVLLGKPHPRKIFRTILRPAGKGTASGAAAAKKK